MRFKSERGYNKKGLRRSGKDVMFGTVRFTRDGFEVFDRETKAWVSISSPRCETCGSVRSNGCCLAALHRV